ncbi:ficolin-2-like [Biomphalaria glabrata]|uniref:Ficolin-2-like n=1 Tax=Biomphalaria glabrata TaxID=6526 RepID=A0A9W2YCG3_BIOGL|nr:ficolin-2-like [Biomphalaria glabrata]
MKGANKIETLTLVGKICRTEATLLLALSLLFTFNFDVCRTTMLSVRNYTKVVGCYASSDESLVVSKCLERKMAISFLHCISQCSSSTSCKGVVKDRLGGCYFYAECEYIYLGNCKLEDPVTIAVYLDIVNFTHASEGGETTSATNSGTRCIPVSSGTSCESGPKLCNDSNSTGLFWIEARLANLTQVLCEVTSSGEVKVYAFKNDGTADHNKSWSLYSQGYYINDNNFWLGLENMRSVISSNFTNMKLELVFNSNAYNFNWDYSGVAISNSSTHYTLTYANSKVNSNFWNLLLKNCLVSGKSFSTIDSDNDDDSDDLAAQGNSGWWFEDTGIYNILICNPMGRLTSTSGKMTFFGIDVEKYANMFTYVGMYFYK